MEIDIKTNAVVKVDINSSEALNILCKTLDMDFALDEEKEYFVAKNEYGENAVFINEDGHDKCIDDRGDLFIALRNVIVNMYPNVYFRNDNYIYNN